MRIEKGQGYVVGVKCDLCGSDHAGDFTYCSLDVREVRAVANRNQAAVASLPVMASLDACPKCVGELAESMRIHYAPTRVGVNCDVCPAQMRGDYTFYYVSVSSVKVEMSAGGISCRSCGRPAACKCDAPSPAMVAAVTVDDKYLQLVMCQRDYDKLSAAAAATVAAAAV